MYQDALDIYPKGAEELIATVRANDSMEVLLDLENVVSKPILFEQYILEENYAYAAPLILDIDFDIPERQESIIKSYIYTGDLELSLGYANRSEDPEMKAKVVGWHKDYVEKQELSDDEKKTQIEEGTTLINREMDV